MERPGLDLAPLWGPPSATGVVERCGVVSLQKGWPAWSVWEGGGQDL